MLPMPTQQALEQAKGMTFDLWVTPEQRFDVELLTVTEGIAMTPRHQCFCADFALPEGTWLPQALFRLALPGEDGWLVLMAPGLPDEQGRNVLQAVFHMDKPT
ncbi:DUF6916 family protein [Pseudomonas sp. NY15181]|uniref:DUF6916 family protein n=1 Tax=Pseudomonas sp. NY15181 TaxID=3400349 RepID=UPI003A8B683E